MMILPTMITHCTILHYVMNNKLKYINSQVDLDWYRNYVFQAIIERLNEFMKFDFDYMSDFVTSITDGNISL